MADARIQMQCDGCGKDVTFPAETMGTVQECPECGGYLDVPGPRTRTVFDEQSETFSKQSEVTASQQEATERQIRRTDQQQEQQQRILDLNEQLLAKASRMFDRWDALAARAEQALSDLENRSAKP